MSGVAVANHITCTVAFLTVTAILSIHRPTLTQFRLLIIGCGLLAVWSTLVALHYYGMIASYTPVMQFEIVTDYIWFLTLLHLLQMTQRQNRQRRYFRLFSTGFVTGLVLFLLGNTYYAGYDNQFTTIAHILFCIMMLSMVEQLYRGTMPQRRIGIKLFCIAVGLMYSYDLFMYAARAALANELCNTAMEIRGGVLAVIAPLIGLCALSHRKWQTEILPSRALIFRSTVYISSGIYLLCMALMGVIIRKWAGPFGSILQVAFFVGSLMVLYLILSSGKVRAALKLYISKNFFKLRYDYREEWLKFSTLLSTYSNQRQLSQSVIKAMAGILESPKGVLFELEDKRGYVLKDCYNEIFPNHEMVIEKGSFVEYLEKAQRPIELPPRFIDNPLLKIPGCVREFDWAWLVVPLYHGTRMHAFVVLAHPQIAFFSLNWEVMDLLAMAGRQAAVCLAQEQSAQALSIAKRFEEFNQLSAFVMHDLKNVNSQLRLIESNREKYQHDSRFINSCFQTVTHVADRLDHLLVQMKTGQSQSEKQEVQLLPIVEQVIELNAHRKPVPKLDWRIDDAAIKVVGNEESYIHILSHLIENAQQATPQNGEVILTVHMKEGHLEIAISDTGCGMSPEFVHMSLYRPFVTTKGENGVGIGVYEAREYLHHVGGKLTVETVKDKGSIFRIAFPSLDVCEVGAI